MIRKVDLLLPVRSQYQVLHHFTRKLYEAFQRAGFECRLLDGEERTWLPIHSPPDVTIGFNGAVRLENDRFLCDQIKVPHIACLVDPPYRFLDLTKSSHMVLACDDQQGCKLLKEQGFNRTLFMPHAVEPEVSFDPQQKRDYDVVFLGTCIDCEARRKAWKENFSASERLLMDEATEATFGDDTTSFITVLGRELSPWTHKKIFEEVELYIKGRERLELLDAVHSSVVHIFGNNADKDKGWKELLKHPENVVVHPAVSFEEAIEIMKRSKVVLNSSIKNKLGAHERIFTAAACGAIVVTNNNSYIAENFTHGHDMLLYRRKDMDSIDEEIAQLLSDENRRAQIVESGARRTKQYHIWDCRVKTLLAALACSS